MASKLPSERTPEIFQYLDYRKFLADWYKAKKLANARFSYRVFARKAGQRSPSLLHHVIDGKRNLTPATAESFCKAMGLKTGQTTFFNLLVQLDQAKSPEDRNQAWEQIASTRRFRDARHLEGSSFTYLSRWYFPALRELANRSDFQDDPEWIAQTLRPRITVPQARKALESLLSLGLLVPDDHGKVTPAEASVVTPHEVAGLAVFNYHQGMLERAAEALRAFEGHERHYGAVTVAVPESLVPRLKEEIGAFQERILNLCDGVGGSAERVYQLNLQLFPLSAAVKEKP